MIARGMKLALTGDPVAAYASAGMLKPAHALMMHGVLILPALAWILSFVNSTEQRRRGIVLLATSGYTLVCGVVTLLGLDELFGLHQPALLKIVVLAIGATSFGTAAAMTLIGVVRSDGVDGIHRSTTADPAMPRGRVEASRLGTRR